MTPRKGDKVRVTYEAEYRRNEAGEDVVAVDYAVYHVPANATVEVIEPVEDLRPGDVYRTADGRTVVLCDGSAREDGDLAWVIATEEAYAQAGKWWLVDAQVHRPLTLLVRDGMPVTSP